MLCEAMYRFALYDGEVQDKREGTELNRSVEKNTLSFKSRNQLLPRVNKQRTKEALVRVLGGEEVLSTV